MNPKLKEFLLKLADLMEEYGVNGQIEETYFGYGHASHNIEFDGYFPVPDEDYTNWESFSVGSYFDADALRSRVKETPE